LLSRLSKLFLILALSTSIGLHWAFLQSVAWMSMLVSYSHSSAFAEAVVKTFDGQHPCRLCNLVEDGKKTEKAQKVLKPQAKLDFLIFKPVSFIHLHPQAQQVWGIIATLRPRTNPPPLPPPRLPAVTL
jgi:hypothetical protein